MAGESTTTTKQDQEPTKSEWELLDEAEDKKYEEFLKSQGAAVAPDGKDEGDEPTDDEPVDDKKPDDEPEDDEEPEPEDTPLEDLSHEELIQRHKDAIKLIETHKSEASSVKSRYDDAQRRLTEATMSAAQLMRQTEALTEIIKKKEAAALVNIDKKAEPSEPTQDIDTVFNQLDDEEKSLVESLKLRPVLKSMEKTIKDQAEVINSLKGNVEKVNQNVEQVHKSTETLSNAEHFKKIDGAHEGWRDMLNTKDFETYIETLRPTQKTFAAQVLKNGTAEQVIDLFSDFKDRTGWKKNGDGKTTTTVAKTDAQDKISSDKLEKAKREATPPSKTRQQNINQNKGKPKFTRAQIAKMPLDEFVKREKEIDAAVAAGEVW